MNTISTKMAYGLVMLVAALLVSALFIAVPAVQVIPGFGFLLVVSLVFDIAQFRLAQEGKTEFLGFDWRAGIFVAAAILQIAIVWLWDMK